MKQIIWTALIFLSTLSGSLAQVGSILYQGRLIDDYSEEPIIGATVELTNSENRFETVSDTAGHFTFLEVPAGSYQISLQSLGYQTKRVVEL